MTTSRTSVALHSPSEGEYAFPTSVGRVRLAVSSDYLAPFGGLVSWAAFTKHISIIQYEWRVSL